jgi:MiaB/RimO family radical SAM methylthiotransferase
MSTSPPQQVKVYISTTGCVEAQLSSEIVAKILGQNNYNITRNVSEADFIIFYACGLTNDSEGISMRAIANLKKGMKKDAKLITWGCLTKQNPEAIKTLQLEQIKTPLNLVLKQNLEESDILLNELPISASTEELMNVREAVIEVKKDPLDYLTRAILLAREGKNKLRDKASGRTKAYYIRVAIGCNGNCTYCSEKPVYGAINSRPMEKILNDFKKGLSLGYNRFSLLATDLGSYGMDIDSNLGTLLNRIIETKTDVNYSLVLNQIEPHNLKLIYPSLKDALASRRVEELMSPVQSGSNKILRLMGRKYTIEDFRSKMLEINTSYPKIRLNTHLMVGFPMESEEDFNETMKILNPPPFFEDITVFKYSSRPPVASRLMSGQISDQVKEVRREKLLKKFARIYAKNFES